MAAVPAGYEAFHSMRRKAVTLLCFLLASSMAMGITVYVDSYSVHEWDKNLDIGEVALIAQGDNIQNYVDEIRVIDGVVKAASIRRGSGIIQYFVNETWGQYQDDIWGDILSPDQEFLDTFPGYITLEEGSFPTTNSSQIAINYAMANSYGFDIGDVLNFTPDWDWDTGFDQVEVIGFYSQGVGESYDYYYGYYETIAIVAPSTITYPEYQVYIDIDRSRLTAFNAGGSLAYAQGIDQTIRELDPLYSPSAPWRGTFWVRNYITNAIYSYMNWVSITRMSQLFRSVAIILLILMVTFLAIRHNVNERRYESGVLYSRGASMGDLDKIVNREVLTLSLLSCVFGIIIGAGISRIALGATGFFQFDFGLMVSEPFLVSLESLIMSVIVGIALPILALGSYRIVYSTKKSVDEGQGRLSKVVKGLNFVKWDVLVVIMAGLLLIALFSGGQEVMNNPFMGLILPVVPLPLFLGVASLSIKGLRAGASRISHIMARIVGQVPAAVGIRRIGKGASSGGAAAMVLVLAICLSWNNAIVDASLPITKTYQAQLSVGADITFALDTEKIELWDNLTLNVTSHESVVGATYVSETGFYLSSGYSGYNTFLAVDAREYSTIGYHYLGKRLNDSEMANLMESLASVLDGAIISEDIAEEYDLEVGDIMRASDIEDEAVIFTFRIVGIVESLPEMPVEYYFGYYDDYYYYPPPPMSPYYYGYSIVGQDRVMINRDYLQSLIGSLNQSYNYLCVSTTENTNGTQIGEDLLEEGGYEILYQGIWDAVSTHTDEYLGQATYHIDRSVDTMLTVLTVGTIMGAFAIYAVEGARERRREIALLRSAGAENSLIVKSQGAEMLVIILFSFVVLLGYSPLFLTTAISSAGSSLSSYYEIYPIAVFPVIPWMTIIAVLAFFFVSVMFFIGFVAIYGSRINLAQTLNATWAEASPYGDEL